MAFLTFKGLTNCLGNAHAKWYKKLSYANNSGVLNSSLVSIAKYKNAEKRYFESQVSYLAHFTLEWYSFNVISQY